MQKPIQLLTYKFKKCLSWENRSRIKDIERTSTTNNSYGTAADLPTSWVSWAKDSESPHHRRPLQVTCSVREFTSQTWWASRRIIVSLTRITTLGWCCCVRWHWESATRNSTLTTTRICFLITSTRQRGVVRQRHCKVSIWGRFLCPMEWESRSVWVKDHCFTTSSLCMMWRR